MWAQRMIRACNKHSVVSFTNSVGSVGLSSYCENIYARTRRTDHKYENVITLTTESVNSLTSSQNAMLFGVLVL